MVEVVLMGGRRAALSPAHVVSVEPVAQGGCYVRMVDGQFFHTKDEFAVLSVTFARANLK